MMPAARIAQPDIENTAPRERVSELPAICEQVTALLAPVREL